jgi:hypothetical protein
MATYWTLGCDAADPHGIAAFWAIALGYVRRHLELSRKEKSCQVSCLSPSFAFRSPVVALRAVAREEPPAGAISGADGGEV